jgi:hypothetical protein
MTRLRLLLFVGIAFVLLLLGVGAGVWWYLFGANEVEAAELVPANTIAFATIPNAATLLEGYQNSQLKTLLDSPNTKPLHDTIVKFIGQKNVDLVHAFLPNLSGQSFIAVTHFDLDHPEQIGLIAAMKPKAGMGDFGTFVEKLKAAWPDVLKQAKTGAGSVAGVDYEWIQGPGAPDRICVAQVGGWIVTSWGEASLQDWVERFRKKSSTSSLAQDLGYRKSLVRVGDDPMTLVYLNYHALMVILQKQIAKTNPAAGDYLGRKLDTLGGAAIASRFENGEIVDRFSFLMPRPAQLEAGMASDPCPFETLKFTGPDTRFYWASSIDWKQYYKNLKEQSGVSSGQPTMSNPVVATILTFLHNWAQGAGLDAHRNIIDALGPELSVQAEWPSDSTYPEAGLFVKLDHPDDFKPTISAVIESLRRTYETSAVIKELHSNGQTFAVLKFVQSSPVSPTVTEDGPYLGVFLSENQAVRSFQRDPGIGLTHNADFNRQVGDKRTGASQLLFVDSPYFLDRAYRTALPYLSLAEMFNRNLAAVLKDRNLPPDLTWLAPMGTWSCVVTPDEDGIEGYSTSGVGNQGLFLGFAAGATLGALQGMGMIPHQPGALGSPYLSGAPGGLSTPLQYQNPGIPPSRLKVAPLPALPKFPVLSADSTANAAPDVPGDIISITYDNKIYFDGTSIPQDQFDDFLKSKKAENESLKLAVRVDRDASPDVLSRVMDAGASAGFGVLPYTYMTPSTSSPPPPATNPGSASLPSGPAPLTNAASPPGPIPDSTTNSLPAGTESGSLTNTPPAVSNSVAAPSLPEPATHAAPATNSNPDVNPPTH